jgi:hypothetical protein
MESDGLSGYGSEIREIADLACKPEGTIFVAESIAYGDRGSPGLDSAATLLSIRCQVVFMHLIDSV